MSLKRNALWNLVGSGLPLVAAAALIPYTLRQLGSEAFGVLTLVWALIGYFSLFDLGVGRALTFELSQLNAAKRFSEISPTLKAGLMLTGAAGMFGALLMWVLAPSLATKWLKIGPQIQADAVLAFKISAIAVIPTTLTSGLRGGLEGLERFAASNLNKVFLGFCMFTLPALSIFLHGNSLAAISIYLAAARFAVVVVTALQLLSFLSTSVIPLARQHLRALLNYGFWVTVTGIVGPLMVFGDRFFVSAAVGASQLPLYAIPQEGLLKLLLIPAAVSGALLPRLASLGTQQAATVYGTNYRRMVVGMAGVCAVAAGVAYPVLSLWLSNDFARAALPIVLVLSLGVWLNSIALVPYTFIHARGAPKITAIFHLIELGLYIVALWVLSARFGLAGAAAAWVARSLLDLVLLHLAAKRLLLIANDKTRSFSH